MGINGISRPYVGQNSVDINSVKQACDKKSGDVTSPATPTLGRAWAFELTADGSVIAPPPPPRGQPGRDPLVIELGQIEVGTRIELISLSDNPKAEFDADHKAEIFALPLSGYNVAGRTATIALNEEQMKEKGIGAGERFLLRQVDKDGNASEAIHIHLDPRGWANTQIDEPVAGGGTQRVAGRTIDIAVGVFGLPGSDQKGTMERVLGKVTTDVTAPILLEGNVSALLRGHALNPKELENAREIVAAINTLIGSGSSTSAELDAQLTQNKASWETHAQYGAPFKVLAEAVSSKNEKAWTKLSEATGGTGDAVNFSKISAAGFTGLEAIVKLDKALEPGTKVQVQNSRTGEVQVAQLNDTARGAELKLQALVDGDPLVITYTDAANNPGKPYGFRFDSKAKDGKAAKSNPLDIRLGGFNFKPTVAPTGG